MSSRHEVLSSLIWHGEGEEEEEALPQVCCFSHTIPPQSSAEDVTPVVTGVQRHPGTKTTQQSSNPDSSALTSLPFPLDTSSSSSPAGMWGEAPRVMGPASQTFPSLEESERAQAKPEAG